MPFNAKLYNKRKSMERLRKIVGDDVRPSDMDGLDADSLFRPHQAPQSPDKKYALHGLADGWFEVPTPYQTSPLVNPYWEMGGRWRDNFPGGGDHHINDDGDKNKNTRGNATNNDFDPNAKKDRINQFLKEPKKPDNMRYVVRINVPEGMDPDKFCSKVGGGAQYDGSNVRVVLDDFMEATHLQRKWPGAIVETMKKEMKK